MVTDQVWIPREFDKLSIGEVVTKLADKSTLDHRLIISFIIEDFGWLVRLCRLHHLLDTLSLVVLLLGGRYWTVNSRQLFELLHDLNWLH